MTQRWGVSRETEERLSTLCSLVRDWSSAVQLVSKSDLDRLEERHVGNSLAIVGILRAFAGQCIVDIGSGAGFPGLVVAIALGRPVHLIESDRRKAAFLLTAAPRLGCDVTVHACRAEDVALRFDIAIARAFGPLPVLWPVARALLTPGGRGIFLKGEAASAELATTGSPGLIWTIGETSVVEMRT